MNVGLYQSAASLSALERWQDAVTQNITSSQVSGYKKRTVRFSDTPMGEVSPDKRSRIGEGQPSLFPTISYGISFQPGEVQPTRRELDVALQGEGFFVVQMSDGKKIYSRGGELHLTAERKLLTAQDGEILTEGDAPIVTLPAGGKLVINPDGTVFQGDVPLGRLQVVKFTDTSKLMPLAGGVFVPIDGAQPEPMEKPEVLQGYLEGSNITPLREMVDLVTISRAYEANQKLIQTQDSRLEKALEKLG